MKKKQMWTLALFSMLMTAMPMIVMAAEEAAKPKPALFATFWALVPPVVAIALALLTKEVYSSLFIGIAFGAVLFAGGNFEGTVLHIFNEGFIKVLSDSYNMGILIFLVMLGTIVALMNKAGGSAAFGQWAETHIKTRIGAQLATIFLGLLIFVDDYFNCLTVGSVMRPITDRHQVSRAKLAYLIDATAAPICIIAPVSSWAAAVSGFVEGEDGFALFISAIPYNFYAILTIITMLAVTIVRIDFGPMAEHERAAINGDVTNGFDDSNEESVLVYNDKATVMDLIVPIASVVVCCVIGMIYTGGFFKGETFVNSFSNCDASVGLSIGSFFGYLVTMIYYQVRKVIPFRDAMNCLIAGFNAMVPAILILTMAWSLKAMTDSLGAKEYVAANMQLIAGNLANFLPAIIFLVGCFLAFSTGTSWGTFGILIPIVVAVFQNTNHELMLISISACMAGAVCGDHCSPISDTTIMASAGANCVHVNHVSTQLPYVILVACVTFISYIIAGFVQNAWVSLPISIAMMVGAILAAKMLHAKNVEEE